MSHLQIKNLHASLEGKEILKGVNLEIKSGEIHALMGPNGSGKSTLAGVFMGKPSVEVTKGEILLDGRNLLEMDPEERSLAGLFLGFQSSMAITGVSVMNLLKMARTNHEKAAGKPTTKVTELAKLVESYLGKLGLGKEFASRYLNDGFSGGEKKRTEILQMMVLEPKIAVLDEIDSGVDIDALKSIGAAINDMVSTRQMGVLMITHYPRLLDYVKPQHVHVFVNGKVVEVGTYALAQKLEKEGYKAYLPKTGLKMVGIGAKK